jgi:hypothetical protein
MAKINTDLDANGEAIAGEADGASCDWHFGRVEGDKVGNVEELVINLVVEKSGFGECWEQHHTVLSKFFLENQRKMLLETLMICKITIKLLSCGLRSQSGRK